MVKKITAKNNVTILAEEKEANDQAEISLRMTGSGNCLLHWGVSRNPGGLWQTPPQSLWPEGSKAYGQTAVQTQIFSP